MFSNSVLTKTGQLWKILLGIGALLAGSIAPALPGSGMSWTVGTIVAVLGYALAVLITRCPGCNERWFWKALLYADMYVPLFTKSQCPSCKQDFSASLTAAHAVSACLPGLNSVAWRGPCIFLCCTFTAMAACAEARVEASCRDVVRPLLLQQPPDQARLPTVQRLCEQQARRGNADAQYQLALLHLGVADWNPDRAIPLIQAAASAGVPEAQYWLAWQLEEGPLLPNDQAEALRWYRAASDQEHKIALDRLALAYQAGELGLEPDVRQASLYRARAARCEQQD